MNRGEMWWGKNPDRGRRPYLVLTRQAAIPVLRRVLAFDDIVAMPKTLLTERICRLGLDRLDDVCRALRVATGC